VSDFYFVDTKNTPRPELRESVRLNLPVHQPRNPDVYVHLRSGHNFRVHRRQQRGEEALHDLPKLGVFFFRGDSPVDGEGSSGVLWLGGDLFSRVLRLLISGGIVVTDGSNCTPDGPKHLSDFHGNRNIGQAAKAAAAAFEYGGRHFTCVSYAGERYGPTLVWRVA
jgi:hypothetical protein